MHAMDVTCNVVFSVSYTDVWRIRSFNHWYSMHVFRLITQPRLLVDVYKSSPTDFQEISRKHFTQEIQNSFTWQAIRYQNAGEVCNVGWPPTLSFRWPLPGKDANPYRNSSWFSRGKSCKSMEIPWNPYETHSHERPRFVSSFSVSIFKMFSVFMDFHKFFVVIPW